MMNNEGLYTIVGNRISENSCHVTVALNRHHKVYSGHFPGHPVLPGVCTLQIIKECLGKIVRKKIRYRGISMCKFTSMIQPTDEQLEISFLIGNDNSFTATVQVQDRIMLKLKANFVEL
ncbi:MAG: hydroxymyristoyl-ACP dehydratase [Rikenellaceae bacterium]